VFGAIGWPWQETTDGDCVTDGIVSEPGMPNVVCPDICCEYCAPFGFEQVTHFRLLHPVSSS